MVSASLELVGGDEPSGDGLAGELPLRGLDVFCDLEVSAPERVLAIAEGVSRPRSVPFRVLDVDGFCGSELVGCFEDDDGLETDGLLSLDASSLMDLLDVAAVLTGSDDAAPTSSSES